MKLTFPRAALATAAALCCAMAHAGGGALDLSNGSTGFFSTPPNGSFTDTYTFTMSDQAWLNSTVTTSGLDRIVDFTSVTVTGSNGNPMTYTPMLPYGFETWGFGGLLPAGDYVLTITGTNTGSGTYAGVVALSLPVPIPEPTTAALWAVGLAVVGLLVRRKSLDS